MSQRVVRTKRRRTKLSLGERIGYGLDRFISIFAPVTAGRRMKARIFNHIAFSSYKGADKARIYQNWAPGGNSADEDLLPELEDLRERSRDLNRNNPIAAGITHTMTTNDIGNGINPQSRVDTKSIPGFTDKRAKWFQSRAERAWKRWGAACDVGKRLDIYDMQELVDRQILENGEVIIRVHREDDPFRPYSLALEIIEADRVSTPHGYDEYQGREIRSGVEIDSNGAPVAYWVLKSHPGEYTVAKSASVMQEHVRIPTFNEQGKRNIFHLYHILRPGQTRGVPFFTPAMTYFKDHAEYQEAEFIAARIAACFALLIETPDPLAAAASGSGDTDSEQKRIEELEPGMVAYTNPGEKTSTFNPGRQPSAYDSFMERVVRGISSSLGLPYELVAMDFSKTNYSSARAALMEARRYFRKRQKWIVRKFLQPIWELLLEEAWLLGELDVDNFPEYMQEFTVAKWIAPGWEWVDPVKDSKATQIELDEGLVSRAEKIMEKGGDWEETFEQIAREKVKQKELEEEHDIKLFGKSEDKAPDEDLEKMADEEEDDAEAA